jgi:hypothetical protein
MSGGIFPNRPFTLNIKCVVITLMIALGYWFLPYKNFYVLIFLLWFPYIAIAYYDAVYDCKDKENPTLFPFGRYIFLPFKPQYYQDRFKKMSPEQIQFMNKTDHLFFWTIIVVVLFFILRNYLIKKEKTK